MLYFFHHIWNFSIGLVAYLGVTAVRGPNTVTVDVVQSCGSLGSR